jgi:hypothetical protein
VSNRNSGIPRVVGDAHLGQIPTRVGGTAEHAAKWNSRPRHWEELTCSGCGGPTYVRKSVLAKYGDDGWKCKECRAYSKDEVHEACVALALRKKRMGLL